MVKTVAVQIKNNSSLIGNRLFWGIAFTFWPIHSWNSWHGPINIKSLTQLSGAPQISNSGPMLSITTSHTICHLFSINFIYHCTYHRYRSKVTREENIVEMFGWYGKRQGTLKNNSEWRTARRIEVRYSMFATPFSIRCAVSYLFLKMFSIQGSLFNVRRAVRQSPRRSPFASSFATPFAIRRTVSYSFSLFKLRYSIFAAPLAIRSSPFVNRRAIRRTIRCRFSMSPDAFHRLVPKYFLNQGE